MGGSFGLLSFSKKAVSKAYINHALDTCFVMRPCRGKIPMGDMDLKQWRKTGMTWRWVKTGAWPIPQNTQWPYLKFRQGT